MSKDVRVILLEDVAHVGAAGEIVVVNEGYARNALFPNGRAALATDVEVSRAHKKQATAKQAAEEKLRQMQEQAQAIEGTELTIFVRTKDDDEIYGKINASHVAKELAKATNLAVKAKDIVLSTSIKSLGAYQAVLSFGNDIEATIHLIIKKQE